MAGLRGVYEALLTRVQSVAGLDAVIDHEPLSAPDSRGVVACVFLAEPVGPLPESSGLAAADARFVFTIRLMRNALAEPQLQREIDLLSAFDDIMDALCGGYTLDGAARAIDVLGESGQGLAGEPGYATLDKTIFRLIDITVPIMLNNVWQYGE